MSKLALAAGALCLLSGCSTDRTFSTKDATVTVTGKGKDQAAIHMTGKDGATVDINSGKAITDYPADVPLYSGKSMMDMKTTEKHARVVAIQTPDSMDKIAAFYKTELDGKGWKTETSMTTPEMNMIVANKDGRKLVIQISADSSSKLQSVSQTLEDGK